MPDPSVYNPCPEHVGAHGGGVLAGQRLGHQRGEGGGVDATGGVVHQELVEGVPHLLLRPPAGLHQRLHVLVPQHILALHVTHGCRHYQQSQTISTSVR